MGRRPQIIDAEFEVISPAPAPQPAAWTWWDDGFPGLCGVVAATLIAGVVRLLIGHH